MRRFCWAGVLLLAALAVAQAARLPPNNGGDSVTGILPGPHPAKLTIVCYLDGPLRTCAVMPEEPGAEGQGRVT